MTEEPYRWLEAIANRREYVREQLKGGSPVIAASLPEGIVLVGVSSGQGKVFEIHDRQAMAALGHPADLERIRQAAIDAAHLEAFTRAPEDVSLRRLVGFGLSAQLKLNFEQLFTAPILGEFVFAELGATASTDLLVRLRFDGSFTVHSGGVVVVAPDADVEAPAAQWLSTELANAPDRNSAISRILETWWLLMASRRFNESIPASAEREAGWRAAIEGQQIEVGWLARNSARPARYEPLDSKVALARKT
ncbi:MAG TPA: hypothetical protein PLX89_06250 [Verrucomicrobiota bacterium]|nr:hypothetical protein [Verrucomicrobiota bacterium]